MSIFRVYTNISTISIIRLATLIYKIAYFRTLLPIKNLVSVPGIRCKHAIATVDGTSVAMVYGRKTYFNSVKDNIQIKLFQRKTLSSFLGSGWGFLNYEYCSSVNRDPLSGEIITRDFFYHSGMVKIRLAPSFRAKSLRFKQTTVN